MNHELAWAKMQKDGRQDREHTVGLEFIFYYEFDTSV